MKIAFYSGTNAMSMALALAFKKLGHQVRYRSLSKWRGEVEDFDLVICKGRGREELIEKYQLKEIPCFVLDWGYVKRVSSPLQHLSGHWQIAKGSLNRIPEFDCEPDRLEKLELDFRPEGGDPKGHTLIIGQMPGDTALNGTDHRSWILDQIAQHDDPVYREHPRGGVSIASETCRNHTGLLRDALDGAKLVVTYNSNTGHEALIQGVPVICDPCATYYPLSGHRCPSVEERKEFYTRVAYGQWLVSEAHEAAKFILEWAK